MPEWLLKYVGGGFIVITAYVIISNTLWLLFGSKLLQSLPGVNIKGATGTLRIAVMLLMCITGFLVWVVKYPLSFLGLTKRQKIAESVSYYIQSASKLFHNSPNKNK